MRLAALLTVLLVDVAQAETRVIDGDSLEVNRLTIRLFGIDAPERRDPGGREAATHLRRLVGSRDPECKRVDIDRYGRDVSLCAAMGHDLSLAMVQAGHAVAWCYYLGRLRPALLLIFQQAEAEARREKRGMWAHPFRPWRDWKCD